MIIYMDYLKCHLSYDYEELIEELHEELADGELEHEDVIQILRDDKAIFENYYPIVEWFFEHDLEVIFILEDEDTCTNEFDQAKEHKRVEKELEQYLKIKPFLTQITVKDALKEMEYMDRIIK